jgi:DNA-binding protein H-NS
MATYEEVKQSFQQMEKELQEAWQKERPLVLNQIKEKVHEFNFTAEELGLANPKTIRTARQRYRDPKSDLIWTGQGRKPAWFKQRVSEGYDVESLIDRSESSS